MHGRRGGRGLSEDALLVLMAVAAVLLAMSVAASLTGGPADPDRPRASFVFETNGTDVLVTHYGGDELNGSHVYVESATRGVLGNLAGTDGSACATPVPNVTRGTTCLVPGAAYEELYVVWNGSGGGKLILDRRPAAPTPTPIPTPTPTPTPAPTLTPTPNGTATPTPTPTVTSTPTVGPGTTAGPNGTGTPVGTAGPNGTATNVTATPSGTGTPAGTSTGTPAGAPTPTATPASGEASTATTTG